MLLKWDDVLGATVLAGLALIVLIIVAIIKSTKAGKKETDDN